jgi:dTDP-4-dehydrorhamnose 3,5-epimerase
VTLEDNTEFLYKTTGEYAPECDRGIRFDDPEIGIVWPKLDSLLLSDKDQKQPCLQDAEINFIY